MSEPQSHAPGVAVYHYTTYLPQGGRIVPVQSSGQATLELIESLSAEAVMGSARMAHPSQISELGFLLDASNGAPASRAS